MVRAIVVLALLLAVAVSLPAGEQPKGLPPRVMKAEVDKDGRAFLVVVSTEYRPVAREVIELVNGRQVKRVQVVTVPIMRQYRIGLSDPGVEVYNTDGKRLDMKKLRLAGSVPVLVSADANPVDPFYLRLAREGTLIVVAPRNFPSGPQPMPPVKDDPPPKDEKRS